MRKKILIVFFDFINITLCYGLLVDKFKGFDRKKYCWLYVLVNIYDDFVLYGLLFRVLLIYINGIKINIFFVKEKFCIIE